MKSFARKLCWRDARRTLLPPPSSSWSKLSTRPATCVATRKPAARSSRRAAKALSEVPGLPMDYIELPHSLKTYFLRKSTQIEEIFPGLGGRPSERWADRRRVEFGPLLLLHLLLPRTACLNQTYTLQYHLQICMAQPTYTLRWHHLRWMILITLQSLQRRL